MRPIGREDQRGRGGAKEMLAADLPVNEAALQTGIVTALRLKLRGAVIASVPNEVKRSGRKAMGEQRKKKEMGLLRGFPDLVLVCNGHTLFLEVKAPKGRLSADQRAVHEALRHNGADVRVLRSIHEAEDLANELLAAQGGAGYTGRTPARE